MQTRDELRDALEKEAGEYRRECEYFSYSRLEDEAGTSGWEEAFEVPEGVQNGGGAASESPDRGIDATAAADTPEDEQTNKTSEKLQSPKKTRKPMDVLESQVFKLIQQVGRLLCALLLSTIPCP